MSFISALFQTASGLHGQPNMSRAINDPQTEGAVIPALHPVPNDETADPKSSRAFADTILPVALQANPRARQPPRPRRPTFRVYCCGVRAPPPDERCSMSDPLGGRLSEQRGQSRSPRWMTRAETTLGASRPTSHGRIARLHLAQNAVRLTYSAFAPPVAGPAALAFLPRSSSPQPFSAGFSPSSPARCLAHELDDRHRGVVAAARVRA